jgi:hypothetical protein
MMLHSPRRPAGTEDRNMSPARWKLLFVPLILLVTACVNYGSVDGVDNLWRQIPADEFRPGETTQAEVLDRLGPPSQLIGLQDGVVFYYLTQKTTGTGRVFIVWNQTRERSLYDRAVFFFDAEGVLKEVAYSDEVIGR